MDITELRASSKAAVTITDAASLFDVDPRTVSEGIRQGNIPAIRLGRRIVIPRIPLLALIETGSRGESA